jgi:flagellar biosynthesis/type III secretory pathway M-ring protein FliF/YscJ
VSGGREDQRGGTKEYAPTLTREERVRLVPELKRLSVALFLDQSVEAQAPSLEQAIQAAVGFDAERRDGFTTIVLPFVAPPEAAPDERAALRPEPARRPEPPRLPPRSTPSSWRAHRSLGCTARGRRVA